jgi:hypothetical protein
MLRIEAVSGASAGAMNAAMLVQGLVNGGPERAKYLLDVFWGRVAMASGSPDLEIAKWAPGLLNMFMGPAMDAVRRAALLHYQPSPLLPNPLRCLLGGLLHASVFGRPRVQPGRIIDRVSEIAFGGALRQELRLLAIAQQMLPEAPGLPAGGVLARLRDARVHMIGDDHTFRSLNGGSELDPCWTSWRKRGRRATRPAERWLAANLLPSGDTPVSILQDSHRTASGPAPRVPAPFGGSRHARALRAWRRTPSRPLGD